MQRPRVPAIRRANAAADRAGGERLCRRTTTLAAVGLGLGLAIAPAAVHAAPAVPAPEAAPADPTTTTTTTEPTAETPPASSPTTPSTAPSTTAPSTTAPSTPVTAVVVADVATGAPPLVPQLASQGVAAAGGAASLARPVSPTLPATGSSDPALGLLAAAFAAIGAALVGLARRRDSV